jgi:site-specific recombinase XerD
VGHLNERLKSTQFETDQIAEEMIDTVKKGRHQNIKANEDQIHQFAQPLKNLFASYTDNLRLRKDTFQTIKIYRYTFKEFCAAFPGLLPAEIRAADAKAWLAIKVRKGWNEPSLVAMVCALSLLDINIVKRQDGIFYLPFPCREEKLPSVLSSKEDLALFNPSGNLKHKSIIMMACARDLIENEVATINKTATAINTGGMIIPVKGTKGKKDKCMPLSQALILPLERYYTAFTPREYVFEGQNMDHYSTRSLQRTQSPLVG